MSVVRAPIGVSAPPFIAPIVGDKVHDESSVLSPRVVLARARELRELPDGCVPPVCVLDPDGLLAGAGEVTNPAWACFHTSLVETPGPDRLGIVSCAVGGSFAVLVAEQLVEMGASLVVSLSSAGALDPQLEVGSLVVVGDALRDEGTSYHYLPPSEWVSADPEVLAVAADAARALALSPIPVRTWTTDAPYRETPTAVMAARGAGAQIVEMEAAALYAFGAARRVPVVCIAQVTNRLGVDDGDFAKPDGTPARRLGLACAVAREWARRR
jgi:uridine phosphorylase